VTSVVLPEIRKTGGYRRPETRFAGLSGERVEYERWLLERALLDAQLIALGMQSIRVHFEQMVTDDPEFGAARADTNFRGLSPGTPRERPSIDRIHAPRPTRFCFQPRPETRRIVKPTGSWLRRLNLFRRRLVRLTPALGEPAPAKPASPALPFPVLADGRETFLSNETEVFEHDCSPAAKARQTPCGTTPDSYERRDRQPAGGGHQAFAR
jgi:hypothetical protein